MSDETVIIDRHLYLTEDESRVVEEGDPAGRWLWAAPGAQVKRRDAEQLGAVKADPGPEAAPEKSEAEPKQQTPRVNKQRAKPADKAAAKKDDE
jgi:hypothetical protein